MEIGVVGGGAAGLSAAYALAQRHNVTLFDAAMRPGGHANTVCIETRDGPVAVDTGFIVYNDRTYPNFIRLLSELGVRSEASSMSFAVSLDGGAYEYAGRLSGLFAQRRNLFRPDHWRMIADIVRFFRHSAETDTRSGVTGSLAALLRQGRYSRAFCENHILPMAAAIWSSSTDEIEEFPAETFVDFFRNHGLLSLRNRPQWRTISGGSRAYVDKIIAHPGIAFRGSNAVTRVRRNAERPALHLANGSVETFDHVVVATHADVALSILGAGATSGERSVLGSFGYRDNEAVLHSDAGLMPRRQSVWSSWNHLAASDGTSWISYWMNRLQNLQTSQPIIVSINPPRLPASGTEYARFVYRHPQFDAMSRSAQSMLGTLQGNGNVWFCGSYCGYGFHEDAVQSGFVVADALDCPVPWHDEIMPMSSAFEYTAPRALPVAAE